MLPRRYISPIPKEVKSGNAIPKIPAYGRVPVSHTAPHSTKGTMRAQLSPLAEDGGWPDLEDPRVLKTDFYPLCDDSEA